MLVQEETGECSSHKSETGWLGSADQRCVHESETHIGTKAQHRDMTLSD